MADVGQWKRDEKIVLDEKPSRQALMWFAEHEMTILQPAVSGTYCFVDRECISI